jgi:hypothetical protein
MLIAGCGLAVATALGTCQSALAAGARPALTSAAQSRHKPAPPTSKHAAKKQPNTKKRPSTKKHPSIKKHPSTKAQPTEKQPTDNQPDQEQPTAQQPTAEPATGSECTAGSAACPNSLAIATQNEQNSFDLGGGEVAQGLATLATSTVVGLSDLGLDVIQSITHIL